MLIDDIRIMLQDSISSLMFTVSGVEADAGWAGSPDYYNFRVSVVTTHGEGALSDASQYSFSVTPEDLWTPTIRIYRVPEAKSYRVYASLGTATEVFQAEVSANQSPYVDITLASLITAGSALPGTDSATIYAPLAVYTQAVSQALKLYSLEFPRETMAEITIILDEYAYSVSEYLLDWVENFSQIKRVEYPVELRPARYRDDDEYYIKDGYFCLANFTPTVGDNLYIYYSTGYTESDLSTQAYEALVLIGAAYVCEAIAIRYAHQSNKIIGADTVDYNMRASDFRRIAKDYKKQGYDLLGISEQNRAPASEVVHWGAPWKYV